MDVSVTIVNWNASASLEACLRSVYATEPTLRYEAIVIDNGSRGAELESLIARYPQVRWVRNSTNLGFGRAQNQAIGLARGRYVLLLNNDATVEPDTIPTLVDLMDRSPAVAAIGCPDSRQRTMGSAYSGAFPTYPSLSRTAMENFWAVARPTRRAMADWLRAPLVRWLGQELQASRDREVAWIVGALLCVRKAAFDQVGGFDERFFLFDEDIDLCRRMHDSGWKIVFTTRTSFRHDGGTSSAGRHDIEKIRGDSRALYFRKHHGRASEMLFRLQHYALRDRLSSLRRRRAAR